jgi:hypothetical protein
LVQHREFLIRKHKQEEARFVPVDHLQHSQGSGLLAQTGQRSWSPPRQHDSNPSKEGHGIVRAPMLTGLRASLAMGYLEFDFYIGSDDIIPQHSTFTG